MLLERLLRNASPGAVAAPLLTCGREWLLALLRGGVGGAGSKAKSHSLGQVSKGAATAPGDAFLSSPS